MPRKAHDLSPDPSPQERGDSAFQLFPDHQNCVIRIDLSSTSSLSCGEGGGRGLTQKT